MATRLEDSIAVRWQVVWRSIDVDAGKESPWFSYRDPFDRQDAAHRSARYCAKEFPGDQWGVVPITGVAGEVEVVND